MSEPQPAKRVPAPPPAKRRPRKPIPLNPPMTRSALLVGAVILASWLLERLPGSCRGADTPSR